MTFMEEVKKKFEKLVRENNLLDKKLLIKAKGLSVQQAIGSPKRQDYPILQGKEIMLEADLEGFKGQSFTSAPCDYTGNLAEIINLNLDDDYQLALYVAAINTVMTYLGLLDKTIHCKDEEPEECAKELVKFIIKEYGANTKVGLIGYNPSLLEALAKKFSLLASDLNLNNIGKEKFGVKILDGEKETEYLIKNSELVFFTGSTLCNGSFPIILDTLKKYKKPFYVFGITGAGICKLNNYNRFCPFAK